MISPASLSEVCVGHRYSGRRMGRHSYRGLLSVVSASHSSSSLSSGGVFSISMLRNRHQIKATLADRLTQEERVMQGKINGESDTTDFENPHFWYTLQGPAGVRVGI
ncbi:hypothetical protein IW262DRAFT_1412921 [Armillaria fumosa]|nr:hypothetical protein IW262DRAFT_1412921 [Armillaria fumosa]